MNKRSLKDFQGGGTILYDTVIVDICPYTYVETQRMYNTKSES